MMKPWYNCADFKRNKPYCCKRNLKSGWEEWTKGFMAILMIIFIPAHHIMNDITLQIKLNNSQLKLPY
jgi:hypothetical protein